MGTRRIGPRSRSAALGVPASRNCPRKEAADVPELLLPSSSIHSTSPVSRQHLPNSNWPSLRILSTAGVHQCRHLHLRTHLPRNSASARTVGLSRFHNYIDRRLAMVDSRSRHPTHPVRDQRESQHQRMSLSLGLISPGSSRFLTGETLTGAIPAGAALSSEQLLRLRAECPHRSQTHRFTTLQVPIGHFNAPPPSGATPAPPLEQRRLFRLADGRGLNHRDLLDISGPSGPPSPKAAAEAGLWCHKSPLPQLPPAVDDVRPASLRQQPQWRASVHARAWSPQRQNHPSVQVPE